MHVVCQTPKTFTAHYTQHLLLPPPPPDSAATPATIADYFGIAFIACFASSHKQRNLYAFRCLLLGCVCLPWQSLCRCLSRSRSPNPCPCHGPCRCSSRCRCCCPLCMLCIFLHSWLLSVHLASQPPNLYIPPLLVVLRAALMAASSAEARFLCVVCLKGYVHQVPASMCVCMWVCVCVCVFVCVYVCVFASTLPQAFW